MKKREGKYCNGTNRTGYHKGQPCCANAMVEGIDGKGYCRNHVDQSGAPSFVGTPASHTHEHFPGGPKMDEPETMPWEDDTEAAIYSALEGSVWNFQKGTVLLFPEGSQVEVKNAEEFLRELEDVAESAWCANVPYDGGEAVFPFDPDIVKDSLDEWTRLAARMWPDHFEVQELHPSAEHLIQFFAWGHLPPPLQEISRPAARLAERMINMLPGNPELTAGLRKLLEAKDCFVRAKLAK